MSKFISWNVNGLRAVVGKGFWEYFDEWGKRPSSSQRQRALAVRVVARLMGRRENWNEIDTAYWFRLQRKMEDAGDSVVVGLQMKQPTLAELEKYIRHTKLPFFIKGALSARDAVVCRDLGAAGVILSHHNGLLRYAVPPVMIRFPLESMPLSKDLM